MIYQGYNKDFGPLNLAQVHRYCTELRRILKDDKYSGVRIFHHCSPHFQKQSNACFLMGAFLVVCHGRSADEAFLPFKHLQLAPFRDAGEESSAFECSVLDCLRGLERAVGLSWYNYLKFDYKEYEQNHRLDQGDMNWIVPRRVLALSSPSQKPREGLPPAAFVEKFHKMKVGAVIRLNEPMYDELEFKEEGI